MGEEERGNQGNSVRERERERGSTGLVFHDCALMADIKEEKEKEKEQRKFGTFHFWVVQVSSGLELDLRM